MVDAAAFGPTPLWRAPARHKTTSGPSTLSALGEVDEAIGHYGDMLRLNPNDNQGIRYVLARCLMKRGDTKALKALFES